MVKRYVAAMIRDAKTEEGLTEENFKVFTVHTKQETETKTYYEYFSVNNRSHDYMD